MYDKGIPTKDISRELDVPLRTVQYILKHNRNTKLADRFEYFAQGGFSGCYRNGNYMPSEEELTAGDPLFLLIAEENLQEYYDGLEDND
jgi:hypothetical protein